VKVCIKCNLKKPVDYFGTRSRNSDGKRGRCKKCEKLDRKAYLSGEKGSATSKAYAKKWYAENMVSERRRQAAWAKDNAEHLFNYRRKSLLAKYGINSDIYNSMITDQKGSCKICGTKNPGRKNKHFYVDHCHKTGKVRGLLCAHCNLAIGQFGDNPDIILRASMYVRKEGSI